MPDVYTPILRPGINERRVIQTFGGLSQFTGSDPVELRPLVEVSSDDDLNHLAPFREAGEEVLVDFPEYLMRTENDLTAAISQTLAEYGSREEFFRSNRPEIDVPCISTLDGRPVEYGTHKSIHMALREDFPRIAHRVLVRVQQESFNPNQRSMLREVANLAREDSDIVLFDVIDVGYEEGGSLDLDLQYLAETFGDYETGILNVFDALEGQPRNITPSLAERYECESFGDFAIDRRYPPKGGGRPPVVYLPHYYPDRGRVEVFDGADYDEAAEALVGWDDYESEHCEYCRQAAVAVERGKANDPSLWKRIRMGHYIESMLENQI